MTCKIVLLSESSYHKIVILGTKLVNTFGRVCRTSKVNEMEIT